MIEAPSLAPDNVLAAGHIEDIKLASSKMARRAPGVSGADDSEVLRRKPAAGGSALRLES